jgi:PAS domain-containing protein
LGLKPRLRHLLTAAFILVATLPLLILGTWVTETALEKELSGVSEKHLLLARNITMALDRYAVDVEASFAFFSKSLTAGKASQAELELAKQMRFRHVYIIGNDGKVISFLSVTDKVPRRFPVEILDKLRPQFAKNKTVFSNVMADSKGRATIYLTRRLGADQIAIGALDLGYIRKLQKAIAFGDKGHSAIVDKAGNILAHPKPEWQDSFKNISKIKPVAKMMAGETGVATFYSPVMKSDMISGFTTVPRTGWGVMVPQPLPELEKHAGEAKRAAFMHIILGLFVAAALSRFLSGLLVRPVEAVVKAARKIEGGNLEARVALKTGFAPSEFQELGKAFNAMARDVATVMVQRERVEDELRHAHDDLERRVEERTRELTEEIAERKQAEAALRRSEERLRGAIASLQEGFALFDADDRLVATNEEYLRVSTGARKVLEDGGTFEDVIRANVASGTVVEALGREEEFI